MREPPWAVLVASGSRNFPAAAKDPKLVAIAPPRFHDRSYPPAFEAPKCGVVERAKERLRADYGFDVGQTKGLAPERPTDALLVIKDSERAEKTATGRRRWQACETDRCQQRRRVVLTHRHLRVSRVDTHECVVALASPIPTANEALLSTLPRGPENPRDVRWGERTLDRVPHRTAQARKPVLVAAAMSVFEPARHDLALGMPTTVAAERRPELCLDPLCCTRVPSPFGRVHAGVIEAAPVPARGLVRDPAVDQLGPQLLGNGAPGMQPPPPHLVSPDKLSCVAFYFCHHAKGAERGDKRHEVVGLEARHWVLGHDVGSERLTA